MIRCVGDGESGQVQAGRFAVLRGLQHVLSRSYCKTLRETIKKRAI
jgi:ribosomal protein S9